MSITHAAAIAIAFACLAAPARGQEAPKPAAAPISGNMAYKDRIRPLLDRYCLGCHSGEKPKADLDLAKFNDGDSVFKGLETWELVLDYVESGEMPPKDKPQPSAMEREAIVAWITAQLAQVDCTKSNPGRVTMRRLNKVEYNNTVRDLLAVDIRAGDDFPSDDVGYGFDNIGDVLTLPPILMEKYLAAAQKIAELAIVTDEPSAGPIAAVEGSKIKAEPGATVAPDGSIVFASNSTAKLEFQAPKAGDYIFRVRAFAQQAGTETARMGLVRDGKPLRAFRVDAVDGATFPYEHKIRLPEGKVSLGVAFLNDYYNEKAPAEKRDRNLLVEKIEIQGPAETEVRNLPRSHRQIMIPRKPGATESEYRRAILENLAYRAFRRTPTPDELDRLAGLATMVQKDGGRFEEGIQLALQAILVSPHFLFKVEVDRRPRNPAVDLAFPISDFELATRLSYFLWSSMPDRELLDLARDKKLSDEKVLLAQVKRMIADRKSNQFVENFAGQWLQLRNLENIQPDKKQFPEFDESLRSAMQKEAEMFFSTIMKEDRSILEFLDANWTVVNARLARFYGIPFSRNGGTAIREQYRKVDLPDDRRGGILTMASTLTVTSNPTRTSPVKRGKWVLEQLLGTPPPPPPPNVPELEDQEGKLTGTLRQKMEQHRANPNCAVCHSKLDPLGFGLENFDAVGKWRDKDAGAPIDPSGELPGGKRFAGPKELRNILLERKDDFSRCLTEKMLTYALGRGLEYKDKCVVDQITATLARQDHKFQVLVTEIVKSDPFRKRNAKGRD
ncbi:MAG: DUF1592 domain-containing protein [Isosphaeraceae bacterium]|nr:DUF1592 domain-containing protein [Isosphaeraceae bacterium]